VHNSIMRVCKQLGQASFTVYGLDSRHEGSHVVNATHQKVHAIEAHMTQRVVPDLDRWGGTVLYTPLITVAETYNAVLM